MRQTDDRYSVFMSYSRDDERVVRKLHEGLEGAHFRCWRDTEIPLGTAWFDMIKRVIAQSESLVVVVTASTRDREYVLAEVEHALQCQCDVIPVLIGTKVLPPQLTRLVGHLERHPLADSPAMDVTDLAKRLRDCGVGSLRERLDTELDLGKLRRLREALEPNLERLELLAGRTAQRFRNTPAERFPTVHGLRHSNGILKALEAMLPERTVQDAHASFCLAAAALIHDWGRLSWEQAWCEGSGGKRIDTPVACRRADHHLKAHGLADELVGEGLLEPREAQLVRDICHYHNLRTDPNELSGRLDVAQPAALFRVANACDLGPVRAPVAFWRSRAQEIAWNSDTRDDCFPAVLPDIMDETALANDTGSRRSEAIANAAFWMRNRMINVAYPDARTQTITLSPRLPLDTFRFVPEQVKRHMERMLAPLRPFIGHWEVELQGTRGDPDQQDLSIDDLVLLGASVFTDPDAIMSSSSEVADYIIQSAIALLDPKRPQAEAGESAAMETIARLVHGLNLERPELQLVHWLRRQLQTAPSDGWRQKFLCTRTARTDAPHSSSYFRTQHDQDAHPLSAMAHHAYEHVKKVVRGKDTLKFAVFGQSRPVELMIRYCSEAGRTVEVVTPMMRPVGEGGTLQVAENLGRIPNVVVHVIPDVALAHELTKRAKGEVCHAALMGCEVWIGREAELIASSLGCLTFAQVAKSSGCPLWVFAEEAKRLHSDDRWSPYRDPAWGDRLPPIPTLPLSVYIQEAPGLRHAVGSPVSYPRSETVPEGLVTAIISERGVLLGGRRRFDTGPQKDAAHAV